MGVGRMRPDTPSRRISFCPRSFTWITTDGKILTKGDGKPELLGSGILIRWDEIEYLEFTEAPEEEETYET